MFAVVRTGGKQYRVAQGDKIVVEKLDGNAGDRITLGDILLAGEGSDLKKTDGLTVAAEIVAQAKGEKVTVFKKRRRHNYRRKKGHRQQHTILKIIAIGDQKEQKAAPKTVAEKKAPSKSDEIKVQDDAAKKSDVAGRPTENPGPDNDDSAKGTKASAKKAAPKADSKSTENAAPAKAAKKAPKGK
jgi:large subunit ribosomal protein L21